MNVEIWIAVGVGLAAIVEDLRRRTIPNWLPLMALLGGLGCRAWTGGWRGAGSAVLGAVAGFGVFLIFYLLGGMGGGDVKLMAGFGALLGVSRLPEAALWTAGVGGLMAVLALAGGACRRWLAGGGKEPSRRQSIPYAPAIAVGVWLALIPK